MDQLTGRQPTREMSEAVECLEIVKTFIRRKRLPTALKYAKKSYKLIPNPYTRELIVQLKLRLKKRRRAQIKKIQSIRENGKKKSYNKKSDNKKSNNKESNNKESNNNDDEDSDSDSDSTIYSEQSKNSCKSATKKKEKAEIFKYLQEAEHYAAIEEYEMAKKLVLKSQTILQTPEADEFMKLLNDIEMRKELELTEKKVTFYKNANQSTEQPKNSSNSDLKKKLQEMPKNNEPEFSEEQINTVNNAQQTSEQPKNSSSSTTKIKEKAEIFKYLQKAEYYIAIEEYDMAKKLVLKSQKILPTPEADEFMKLLNDIEMRKELELTEEKVTFYKNANQSTEQPKNSSSSDTAEIQNEKAFLYLLKAEECVHKKNYKKAKELVLKSQTILRTPEADDFMKILNDVEMCNKLELTEEKVTFDKNAYQSSEELTNISNHATAEKKKRDAMNLLLQAENAMDMNQYENSYKLVLQSQKVFPTTAADDFKKILNEIQPGFSKEQANVVKNTREEFDDEDFDDEESDDDDDEDDFDSFSNINYGPEQPKNIVISPTAEMRKNESFGYLLKAEQFADMKQYEKAKQLVLQSQRIFPSPAADDLMKILHKLQENNEPKFTEDQANVVKKVENSGNYYTVLGVKNTATVDEIKIAYENLAVLLHPDTNPAPGSVDAFEFIGLAVSTLCDSTNRKMYDKSLKKYSSTSSPNHTPEDFSFGRGQSSNIDNSFWSSFDPFFDTEKNENNSETGECVSETEIDD